MKASISLQCPFCRFIRHGVSHYSPVCRGLLLYDSETKKVNCQLCAMDMSSNVTVHCLNCRKERILHLADLPQYHTVEFVKIRLSIVVLIGD